MNGTPVVAHRGIVVVACQFGSPPEVRIVVVACQHGSPPEVLKYCSSCMSVWLATRSSAPLKNDVTSREFYCEQKPDKVNAIRISYIIIRKLTTMGPGVFLNRSLLHVQLMEISNTFPGLSLDYMYKNRTLCLW